MAEDKRKQVYDINDLMELFSCGKNTALRLKKEIKKASDITHNNRIVHVIDYEIWLDSARKKGAVNDDANCKGTSR